MKTILGWPFRDGANRDENLDINLNWVYIVTQVVGHLPFDIFFVNPQVNIKKHVWYSWFNEFCDKHRDYVPFMQKHEIIRVFILFDI